MEDFVKALGEVKPAFGAVVDTLEVYRLNGIIEYGEPFQHLTSTCKSLVEQVRQTCTSSQPTLELAKQRPIASR